MVHLEGSTSRLVECRCDGSCEKSGYRSNPVSFGLRVPASQRWEWREGEGRCDGRQVSGLRCACINNAIMQGGGSQEAASPPISRSHEEQEPGIPHVPTGRLESRVAPYAAINQTPLQPRRLENN